MAGLHNTMRRLVAGGAPVVTGLHAVGDSVCTTNPTQGRGRVTHAQLRTAAMFGPTAFRAFWEIMGMIRQPEVVYTDPHVVACTDEVLRHQGSGPSMIQPTHEQLLAALAR
jgi:hypothetical protein